MSPVLSRFPADSNNQLHRGGEGGMEKGYEKRRGTE